MKSSRTWTGVPGAPVDFYMNGPGQTPSGRAARDHGPTSFRPGSVVFVRSITLLAALHPA